MKTVVGWVIGISMVVAVGALSFFVYQSTQSEKAVSSIDDFDEKMKLRQGEHDRYKKEIEQYKEAIKQYQTRVDQYRSEMMRLNDQIKMYAVDRNQIRGELDTSYAKVSDLMKTIHKLEDQVVTFQEWESDVLIPKIMTVNRPYQFVVINQGLRDKIKLGDQFRVKRSDHSIGTLEVERLYPSFSSALITSESEDSQIRPGDFIQRI